MHSLLLRKTESEKTGGMDKQGAMRKRERGTGEKNRERDWERDSANKILENDNKKIDNQMVCMNI